MCFGWLRDFLFLFLLYFTHLAFCVCVCGTLSICASINPSLDFTSAFKPAPIHWIIMGEGEGTALEQCIPKRTLCGVFRCKPNGRPLNHLWIEWQDNKKGCLHLICIPNGKRDIEHHHTHTQTQDAKPINY